MSERTNDICQELPRLDLVGTAGGPAVGVLRAIGVEHLQTAVRVRYIGRAKALADGLRHRTLDDDPSFIGDEYVVGDVGQRQKLLAPLDEINTVAVLFPCILN